MLYAAKSAAPFAAQSALHRPELDKAAEGARTLFTTPPGYLFSDGLVLALTERTRPILWLRLGPEDRDPATLLISLIASAQRLHPGVGSLTLQQMRQRPGPVAGWPLLFATLAREFGETLPPSSTIVLEQVQHLRKAPSTLGLLGINFLQNLPQHIPCILISQASLPGSVLPTQTVMCGVSDLRVDTQDGLSIVKDAGSGLSKDCVRRAIRLVDGRVVALVGILSAEMTLGSDFIQQTVNRSKNADRLLASIARASLSTVDPNDLQALAMAMHLDYSHPALLEATLNKQTSLVGPWIQPLSDGWSRIRRVWQSPLLSILRIEMASNYSALHRAADYLVEQGALDRAIPICFSLGDTDSAARLIASITTQLTNLGQWETLDHWLSQLPAETIQDWPWLLYTRGEIHTLQGHLKEARKTFAEAAVLFSTRNNEEGTCQSLLAESAVAAWAGDVESARSLALTASAKAQAAGLKSFQGWAAWQLGCLNTAVGDLETALAYFSRASDSIQNPFVSGWFQQVEALALKQNELSQQREFHRQAYLNFQHTEQEILSELIVLTSSPPDNLAGLLSVYGWANIPLSIKMTPPQNLSEILETDQHNNPWQGLLHMVGLSRLTKRTTSTTSNTDLLPMDFPLPINHLSETRYTTPAILLKELDTSAFGTSEPATIPQQSKLSEDIRLTVPADEEYPDLSFQVYALGSFRVFQGDRLIDNWPSRKGQLIFKYLLTRHQSPVLKDILMDTFWPDADPEAARRNLHQAIYALRQTLKAKNYDFQFILYENDCYLLNSEIKLWLDYEEFERHFRAAEQLERRNFLEKAMEEYSNAEGLYQGNFLPEDVYEDWLQPRREYLWQIYLSAANRLAQFYLERHDLNSAIVINRRILSLDDSQEQAHQNLIRCYLGKGYRAQAIRQYQLCERALKDKLNVSPSKETKALYEKLIRG